MRIWGGGCPKESWGVHEGPEGQRGEGVSRVWGFLVVLGGQRGRGPGGGLEGLCKGGGGG